MLSLPQQTLATVPNITWDPIKTLFTAGDIGQYCADNVPGVVKIDSTRFDWFFIVSNYTYTVLRGPAEKPNDTIRKQVGEGLDWVNRNGVEGRPWIMGMYKDENTGDIYAIMHLELLDEDGGYPCRYRMGIGKSTDGGLNWSMQGTIIKKYNEQKESDAADNIGGYGGVVKDSFMYVWYWDRPADPVHKPAVARSALSDVLAGRTDKWYKYYNGAFSEPGLGGSFTSESNFVAGGHNAVSYNTYLNKFVYAGGWKSQSLYFSDDGITWGDQVLVEPGDNGATQIFIYAAITTPGFKENTSGRFFDISYWGIFHPDPYRDQDTRYVRRFYIDSIITDNEPELIQPENIAILASPNPFNPNVNIQLSDIERWTELKILNVNGMVVADLTSDLSRASSGKGVGQVAWNGAGHASGVYIVFLKSGKTELKQKILMIK